MVKDELTYSFVSLDFSNRRERSLVVTGIPS